MSPIDLSQYMHAAVTASPGWNLPIEHWSPSSLSMLRRCPRQFQERYLFGRKERPAEAPVTGTAVHAGLERNFARKIETFDDLALVDLLTWYDDEGWEQPLEREQEYAGSEIFWKTSSYLLFFLF